MSKREMGEKSGAADGKQLKGQQLSLLTKEGRERALNGIIFNYETERFAPARDESVTRCQPLFALPARRRRMIFAGTMATSPSPSQQLTFSSSGNYGAARRNGTKKSSCLLRRHTIVFISLHVLPFLFGCL